jgi:hypothetical protein
MSEIDFKELKEWLRHGELKKIAKNQNITIQHASYMLLGKSKKVHMPFLKEVIETATKNKMETLSLYNKFKSIQAPQL